MAARLAFSSILFEFLRLDAIDDHDSEVARALLRGKHGVEDDPHRTVSPTDVTSDIYA